MGKRKPAEKQFNEKLCELMGESLDLPHDADKFYRLSEEHQQWVAAAIEAPDLLNKMEIFFRAEAHAARYGEIDSEHAVRSREKDGREGLLWLARLRTHMRAGALECAVLAAMRLGAIKERLHHQAGVALLLNAEKTKVQSQAGNSARSQQKEALYQDLRNAVAEAKKNSKRSEHAARLWVEKNYRRSNGRNVNLSTINRACGRSKNS